MSLLLFLALSAASTLAVDPLDTVALSTRDDTVIDLTDVDMPDNSPDPIDMLVNTFGAAYSHYQAAALLFAAEEDKRLPYDNNVGSITITAAWTMILALAVYFTPNPLKMTYLQALNTRCPATSVYSIGISIYLVGHVLFDWPLNKCAVNFFISEFFRRTNGAQAAWTYTKGKIRTGLQGHALIKELNPEQLDMLIDGGITVFLSLMGTVPAYLLEDLKWMNVGPNLLRPAFCAMVLNDYGHTRAGAQKALAALGLTNFAPEYLVSRARGVRVVRDRRHNFDDDDTVGLLHPHGYKIMFYRIVNACIAAGALPASIAYVTYVNILNSDKLRLAKDFNVDEHGVLTSTPESMLATAVAAGAMAAFAASKVQGCIDAMKQHNGRSGTVGGPASIKAQEKAGTLSANQSAKGSRSTGNPGGNTSSTAGRIGKDAPRTWHTCKNLECGLTFAVKATTKDPKHQPGSFCGRCVGGRGCQGCAFD